MRKAPVFRRFPAPALKNLFCEDMKTMTISRRVLLKGAAALGLGALALPGAMATDFSKAIIIYYSRSGNTESIARVIAEATGAKMLRIDVKEPYAEAYSDMTDIARDEVRRKARRELKTEIPDLSGYEVVYLGSPYWWGSLSVPMSTFLMTSGSSSPSGALSRIRELCPAATMGEHFYVPGSEARDAGADIRAWLRKIGAVK